MPAIRSAYGWAICACSCARRSLDAATIFMAEVIFFIFRTLPMLLRRSLRLGMGQSDTGGSYEKTLTNWAIASASFVSVSFFNSRSVRIASSMSPFFALMLFSISRSKRTTSRTSIVSR